MAHAGVSHCVDHPSRAMWGTASVECAALVAGGSLCPAGDRGRTGGGLCGKSAIWDGYLGLLPPVGKSMGAGLPTICPFVVCTMFSVYSPL